MQNKTLISSFVMIIFLIITNISFPQYNHNMSKSSHGDESTWTTRGPNMGQVRALAISPTFTNDSLVLAGDEEMGIWRSEDGGVHWILTAAPDEGWDEEGQAIGALSFSSNFANDNEIFAASRATVYRSRDNGDTWENIGPGGSSFAEVVATSPDYANDRTLIMLPWSTGTLYKSTDAGQTWESIDLPFGMPEGLVFSPNYANDSTLFGGGIYPHGNGGIYKSTDGGTTWNRVGGNSYIFSIAISPNYAQDGTVFAGSIDGIVFRSINGGQTWKQLNLGSGQMESLAISPHFASDSTVFAGTYSGNVYRSTDAGETWESIVTNPRGAHALAISPNFFADRTVLFGSNRDYPPSGVYRSLDGGDSWEQVGLPMIDCNSVAAWLRTPGNNHVLAGTQWGIFRSLNSGETWSEKGIGKQTFSISYSPVFEIDNTAFAGMEDGVYRTPDGGESWTRVGLHNIEVRMVTPSPSFKDDGTLFAGTYGSGVWRSPDGGDNWLEINEGLVNKLTISLAISSNFLSDLTIFVGTNGNGVFKSTDRGSTWQSSSYGLLNQVVYSLAISPSFSTDQTLLAGTFRGVYRSTNGGVQWTRIGLETVPVYSVKFSGNYDIDQTLYVGSPDSGILVSTDGGTNWQSLNKGLWSKAVNDIDVYERNNSSLELYAALTYASVWNLEKSMPTAVTPISKETFSNKLSHNYPNPFNQETVIKFVLNKPTPVSISIFDISGRLVCELVKSEILYGEQSIVWDGKDSHGIAVSSGIYLLRLLSVNHDEIRTRKMLLIR